MHATRVGFLQPAKTAVRRAADHEERGAPPCWSLFSSSGSPDRSVANV